MTEVINMPNGDKPIVKCSVANCGYWGEQNICKADLIMIDIDKHAKPITEKSSQERHLTARIKMRLKPLRLRAATPLSQRHKCLNQTNCE